MSEKSQHRSFENWMQMDDIHCDLKLMDNPFETDLTLGLRPAIERRRYKVTPYLINWAQT